jgi:predicted transcriptional regulator
MTDKQLSVHIGSLADMGDRFVAAWKSLEAGQPVHTDNVTFIDLASFMTAMSPKRLELMRHLRREGPMSIRRLAQQLQRDYKSVHSETSLLIQTGLIARTAKDEVQIGWDRIVTELDLAA